MMSGMNVPGIFFTCQEETPDSTGNAIFSQLPSFLRLRRQSQGGENISWRQLTDVGVVWWKLRILDLRLRIMLLKIHHTQKLNPHYDFSDFEICVQLWSNEP